MQQSPDGKYIASGAIDGIINIFDMTTGKLLHTLEGMEMCYWHRLKIIPSTHLFLFSRSGLGLYYIIN